MTSVLVERYVFPFVIVHHGSRRRPGHNSLEQTTLMAEFLVGKKVRVSC